MTKSEENKLREELDAVRVELTAREDEVLNLQTQLTAMQATCGVKDLEIEELKKTITREEGYYNTVVKERDTLQKQLNIVNCMLDAFPNPPPRSISVDDRSYNDVVLDIPARLSSWLANNLHPTRKEVKNG